MTYDDEFEVDIVYKGDDLTVTGQLEASVENDSFDYAGTHCTGGKSGTHELPDYLTMTNVFIDTVVDSNDNDFPISDSVILAEIESLCIEALQAAEDDNGDYMKKLIDIAEDSKVQQQLDYYDDRT